MIPVAYAADKFGRRKTIQIGAAVYMYVFSGYASRLYHGNQLYVQAWRCTTNGSTEHGYDVSWPILRGQVTSTSLS